MDTALHIVIYVLLGLSVGFVGAVVGIGGGLFAIPILGLFFGLSQQLAQGTALVMIFFNIVVAVFRYHQRTPINFKMVALTVLVNVLVTHLAALLAIGIDSNVLRHYFAAFLSILATFYLMQTFIKKNQEPRTYNNAVSLPWSVSILMGIGSGFIGGFFGVGGSLIIVPVLTIMYCFRQTAAQGVALAVTVPGSLMALISYGAEGQTDWLIGASMAVGGVLAVKHGVGIAHKLPEKQLKRLFALVLYITVFLMLSE